MSKGSKGISQFANTFIIAAERCSFPRPLPDGKIEMPLIHGLICRAFSIELNFKALITQEGSKARGHKLDYLFNQLNESTRNEIIRNQDIAKYYLMKN